MHGSEGTHGSPARRRAWRPVALVGALALVLAACGGGRDDNKATDTTAGGGGTSETTAKPAIDTSKCATDPTTAIEGDTIKLGTSLPQSGLYSAFTEILKGEKAYFEYVNGQGGVEIAGKKYKIEVVDKDDQYEAEKTVTNVQQLVNDSGVFALFNVVGTKNNLAIRDFVNDNCVPDLFAATGATQWGNPDFPWLIGSELVPYPLEMKAFADYLQKNKPDAKVAILRASDDFGRSYSEAFKNVIKGTKITIAKEEQYNPEAADTKAQVTSLAATKADAFIVGGTLLACPDALKNAQAAGWKPIVYMSGTCTSKTLMTLAQPAGDAVLSVAPVMDPNDPANASTDAMKLYKEQVPKFEKDADVGNGIVAYGWTTAAVMVATLEKASAPTRLAVMEAARNLDVSGIGLMVDGQKYVSGPDDPFLGESFDLVQYSKAKGYFSPVGGLIDENGKTASYTPADLING